MLPKKEGAGVIIFRGNQVLLVKSGPQADHISEVYGFPAGTIQQGETIKTTAVRELLEETGLSATVNDLQEFPNNYFEAEIQFKSGKKLGTITLFICNHYSGEIKANEETTPEWHRLDEIQNLNLLPNVALAINNAQTFLKA